MVNYQKIAKLILAVLFLLSFSLGTSCGSDYDFDKSLKSVTTPYRFSLLKWELNAFSEGIKQTVFERKEEVDDGAGEVFEYFSTLEKIKGLESEIAAIKVGNKHGELALLETELSSLQQQNNSVADTIEKLLEIQIKEALTQQGIFNPVDKYLRLEVCFPPVNFDIEKPPYLLVVSPRDRIESTRETLLLPDLTLDDIEHIEEEVDNLGVSSLVVEIGGFAAYPGIVTNKGNLRFTINAATEEWLHQYLSFKPLGFLYVLDLAGIHRDYEIATMNETLAGMVSKEIGAIVYEKHYAKNENDNTTPKTIESDFDFNQEMREIRKTVDEYLARGEIEQAEEFMEQKRQFLATKGYYIRKLNQAYFAFHGTYADRPTSISPIGVELKKLRIQSVSLKEFLEEAAAMTSRQELTESVR